MPSTMDIPAGMAHLPTCTINLSPMVRTYIIYQSPFIRVTYFIDFLVGFLKPQKGFLRPKSTISGCLTASATSINRRCRKRTEPSRVSTKWTPGSRTKKWRDIFLAPYKWPRKKMGLPGVIWTLLMGAPCPSTYNWVGGPPSTTLTVKWGVPANNWQGRQIGSWRDSFLAPKAGQEGSI